MKIEPGKNFVQDDYNFICDRTGKKGKFSEMREEWTGHWVHKDVWEARHPQDFLRGRRDTPGVKIARPKTTRIDLGTNEVTIDDL